MSHTEAVLGSVTSYSRRSLPEERKSITHRFEINGNKGIVIVGLYEDGQPGEIFLKMHKEGSTVSGLLNAIAKSVSIALQSGVPLKTLVKQQANEQYEPSGMTKNPCIPQTKSLTDYISRWLGMQFLSLEELKEIGVTTRCDECEKAVKCGGKTYACTIHPLRLVS
jgi:ribonucleoside-diphosphate reductase alpha chain